MRFLGVAVALSLVFAVGCSNKQSSSASSGSASGGGTAATPAAAAGGQSKTFTIVLMPKLIGTPYFSQAGEGAVKAGQDLGVNVIYNGPTSADVSEQIRMLEDYITAGVNALCVSPNDATAMDPVLTRARNAGILILDWDAPANPDLVDASIRQISDRGYAEHLMQKMAYYLDTDLGIDSGEWAIITGGLSAENLNTWIRHATEYVSANYPGLTLVADPFPTDEKQDVALSSTRDIMRSYPNVKALYGVSTNATIGAGLAIRELGLQDQVVVIGAAVKEDVEDLLSDGSVDCGSLWNCHDLGYLTIAVAKYMLEGNSISNGTNVPGWGVITMEGDKNVILGPPEDYERS